MDKGEIKIVLILMIILALAVLIPITLFYPVQNKEKLKKARIAKTIISLVLITGIVIVFQLV